MPAFSRARLVSFPLLPGVVAYLGLPPRPPRNVSWDVLLAESPGTGTDAASGGRESTQFDFEDSCLGLQHRRRGLFDSLEDPFGTAGLESCPLRCGHLKENV